MKLVVGLGNPGRRYEQTRHNVGFEVITILARQYGQGSVRNRFSAEVLEAAVAGTKVLLLCPQTYMNRSGQSVRQAADFYQLTPADVLILCDDFHLPLGKLRFRASGSAGGQKGLDDVIRHFGTNDVPRLRIGVGEPPANWDPADYVLGKFTEDERSAVEVTIARAASGVADWSTHGISYCMNHYN